MGKPRIDIQVDESTGRWTVDSLPMILVPQHFFLNNHYVVEKALGAAELERILRPAGYLSAHFWCQKEAEFHKLTGEEVLRHYLGLNSASKISISTEAPPGSSCETRR